MLPTHRLEEKATRNIFRRNLRSPLRRRRPSQERNCVFKTPSKLKADQAEAAEVLAILEEQLRGALIVPTEAPLEAPSFETAPRLPEKAAA